MKVAAIQSNYLPWKGYFDIINDVDIFMFYDEVQYTKNDWRNRNQIYSKNGRQWLTIPVRHESVKHKISEVTFADTRWQRLHHKSLTISYAGAAYFFQLKSFIDELLLDNTWERLIDVNRFAIQKISGFLGIKTKFVDAKDFFSPNEKVESLLNVLTAVKAKEYVSGPSGRAYIDPQQKLFADRGIKLHYKDYGGYPSYNQFGKPFEGNVSIVDLLAHVQISEIPDYIWGWRSVEQRLVANR